METCLNPSRFATAPTGAYRPLLRRVGRPRCFDFYKSLADADDAALMRLLRLNLSSFAETSVSTPVNHTGSLSNKRESAVYPCALHYTGHTRAFLPETFGRKARYHAANALQVNQPRFPSAVLSIIENKTF